MRDRRMNPSPQQIILMHTHHNIHLMARERELQGEKPHK
jgi:hypothetical protein